MKTHKWTVSPATPHGDMVWYTYSGTGASFEAPAPEVASTDTILQFLSDNGVSKTDVVRLALKYWIESKKRLLAAGGIHAVEAQQLRRLAKLLRSGEAVPPELVEILQKLR